MEKILTISIAAYNIENYIDEALQSIIASDCLNKIEVLVINDGSTDSTEEISEQYIKLYPKTINVISKENGGWGSTVNVAINYACGKYFKLLDGDDKIISKNLKAFIEYLESNDSDMIVSKYREFYESSNRKKVVEIAGLLENQCTEMQTFLNAYLLTMHSITIKTELLKKNHIKLRENCFYTDNEFVAECIAISKSVCYFNKEIYDYRIGREGQSISICGYIKHLDDLLKVGMDLLLCYRRILGESNNKKQIGKKAASVLTTVYVIIYNLKCSQKNKRRLMTIDRKILDISPDIYYMMSDRIVQIGRKTNFINYPLICIAMKMKNKLG